FPDNETCLRYLFHEHHARKRCPECGGEGTYHLQKGTSRFVCQCGGHQISPKAGTIFEKSDTDLTKWFYAIFLFSQSGSGVAAKELERTLGVTYKTAWRMAQQIRCLMEEDPVPLQGEVEVGVEQVNRKLIRLKETELATLAQRTSDRRSTLERELATLDE